MTSPEAGGGPGAARVPNAADSAPAIDGVNVIDGSGANPTVVTAGSAGNNGYVSHT